ncbi:MAG TPA: hypothetical protein VEG44_08085 [Candidatus Acidoferrales bacterium]|nr:hypothetical protein [Candidatus Acidoferrales bacterium]
MSKKPLAGIFLVTLMMGAIVGGVLNPLIVAQGQSSQGQICVTKAQVDLKMEMRKLWEDHIMYTRMVVVEIVANSTNDATVARLLRNQDDIGNAIKPYYGDAAGNKLADLLKQHELLAGGVINAAKAGNSTAFDAANKQWFANADQIAAFLSQLNPTYWPEPAMKSMFYEHLHLVTAVAIARLHGDSAADIQAYDNAVNQALMMADIFANGIMGQFPAQFC